MRDMAKLNKTFLKELNKLQDRIVELETAEVERDRIEEALRESEERYRKFVENFQGIAYRAGENWTPEFFHGAVEDITGYTEEEIIAGKPTWDRIIHPEDFLNIITDDEKKLHTVLNHSYEREYRIICKDGQTRWVRDYIKSVSLNPFRLEGAIYDITDRKKAEEALRESEERFRGVAEESFDIIFIMDRDGNFTYISPAIKRILGYRPKDLLGKSLEKFLPKIEMAKIDQVLTQFRDGHNLEALELKTFAKDGSTVYFEINATPQKKKDEIIGFQGIARNITERKRAQDEMKKRLMKFKLEEGKVYLVQEATSMVSHEAFNELLKVGYSGTIISRIPINNYQNSIAGGFEFLWLSENGGENVLSPNLKKILNKVRSFPKRKTILIDRLDYLISKHGFKKVLSFAHNLTDYAIISNYLIILSIDPYTLTKQKLRLLEKETFKIEPMYKPNLAEHLLDILKYIYGQNIHGTKPTYTDIGRELTLCKPTIRKRIRSLISDGYIVENLKGRSKVVEITEHGKNFFLK